MADTALSTVNRSSTGSRAGCSPQGWEGCLVVQFLLPMPPVELFTPGDAAAGPASGPGMYPNTPTTKSHADCSSGCPSPPPAACWFLLQPSQLNSSRRLLNPVLKHVSFPNSLLLGLMAARSMGWGRTMLSWRVRRRVEEKLSPEEWCQGDNPVWSEEGNYLWSLSWQHQTQPRVFHGLRKYLHFPASQMQELKRQSFSFWF